jgi:hypothetical protein
VWVLSGRAVAVAVVVMGMCLEIASNVREGWRLLRHLPHR